MGISVSKAMNIGGLTKCKIVAGKNGIDRQISYITVMEVPDTIKWLKGEDLLLTSLYPVKDDPEALSQLVAQLYQKGSAALAIKTHRFIEKIPEVIINEGNRLNFPIIEIEKDIPYLDITTPLMKEILDTSSPNRDIEELLKWLSELTLEGRGLDSIMDALTKILENTVTLESEIPLIKGYAKHRLLPLDSQAKSQLKKMKRPMRTNRQLGEHQIPCIVAPLILNKELQGYITCWETKRKFQKSDFVILERVIPLLALEFLKVRTKIDVEQKYKNEFLAEFLNGKLEKAEEIMEKARIYNWNLGIDYQMFVFNIDQFSEIVKQFNNNEIMIQEYKSKILRKLESIISAKNKSSIVAGWSDYFVILYPIDALSNEPKANPKESSLSFIKKVYKEVCTELGDVTFTVGIGRFYKGLKGIQLGYKDALQSLKLGREIWGRNKIIHFDDLGIYRLLCQFKDTEELEDLYKETIGILVKYDQNHNVNLTETLIQFFKNNCGLKETANAMFIHVNTLKYRLQKIEQLTGYSLSTSEGRLQLHLGLKFQHVLHSS